MKVGKSDLNSSLEEKVEDNMVADDLLVAKTDNLEKKSNVSEKTETKGRIVMTRFLFR